MTFFQYQGLDEEEKELVFWEQAVEIAERRVQGFIYILYQVDGFYIEVQYNISMNYIQSFTAFETMKDIDPYLNLIPIQLPFKS